MSFIADVVDWISWNGLYTQIFIIFVLASVSYYAVSNLKSRFTNKYKNKNCGTVILIGAMIRFLNTCITVVSITWSVQICLDYFHVAIIKESTLLKVQSTIVIVIFAQLLVNTVKDFARALSKMSHAKYVKVNVDTIQKLSTIFQILIFIIAIMMIMNNFGVNLAGLLAFGGIGGIVLGFAAKDMVSNIFGALVITMDRPFAVGDRISLIGINDMEGVVEEINWRFTKMMTIKCYPVYIPNMFFLTHIVENHTRMTHRRIKEILKVKLKGDCDFISMSSDLNDMLKSHPGIDSENKYTLATVMSSGEHVCEVLLQAFTYTQLYVEYQAVKQSVFVEAAKIFKRYNAFILVNDAQFLVNAEPSKL